MDLAGPVDLDVWTHRLGQEQLIWKCLLLDICFQMVFIIEFFRTSIICACIEVHNFD